MRDYLTLTCPCCGKEGGLQLIVEYTTTELYENGVRIATCQYCRTSCKAETFLAADRIGNFIVQLQNQEKPPTLPTIQKKIFEEMELINKENLTIAEEGKPDADSKLVISGSNHKRFHPANVSGGECPNCHRLITLERTDKDEGLCPNCGESIKLKDQLIAL